MGDVAKRTIRRGVDIGAVPTDAALDQKVDALFQRQTILHSQFIDLRLSVSADAVRKAVGSVYGADVARLEKLRNDCVKVLGLMREKGMVTNQEIQEALDG